MKYPILPNIDFETYSEAGYVIRPDDDKLYPLPNCPPSKKGLRGVGSRPYFEHPTADILSLAYDLLDGLGARLWVPGMPNPDDLFEHVMSGKLLSAWNIEFELGAWNIVARKRYAWPRLCLSQVRCSMARAQAFSLPGSLDLAGKAIEADLLKNPDGKKVLDLFSVPQTLTKNQRQRRLYPADRPEMGGRLYVYNRDDILSESAIAERCPPLEGEALQFWFDTMRMNERGIGLDMVNVAHCAWVVEHILAEYEEALRNATGGQVGSVDETDALCNWATENGYPLASVAAGPLAAAIADPACPPHVREALEIRQVAASSSVKKVFIMQRQAGEQGRAYGQFVFNRARTGRDGARDVQPQNMPKAGPNLNLCEGCGAYNPPLTPTCSACRSPDLKLVGWTWEGVEMVLAHLATRNLSLLKALYGDPLLCVSGVLRSLFVSAPGYDLICSDFSAIEAVVTAVLAGEQWRIDTIARGDCIYLASASRITGTSVEEYKAYKTTNGSHHPDRQKIGKPAELGLGFGGWVNAWLQFDDSGTFTEDEIKKNVLAWRAASPAIVEFWGGQVRGKPWRPESYELYGLEGHFIKCVQNPGTEYEYRGLKFLCHPDKRVTIQLYSGRLLHYHNVRLVPSDRWDGQLSILFDGYNTNPKAGPIGWVTMNTYGGRLCENVVQGTANDVLRFSIRQEEDHGYPVVMRIHDEIVAEVPEGFGSVEAFESIMQRVPSWAQGWPIRASGGYRAKRYRKD